MTRAGPPTPTAPIASTARSTRKGGACTARASRAPDLRLIAALFVAAACALSCAPPPATDAAPSAPALARGVTGYRVLLAGAHDLDVELLGSAPARLRARATPDATDQWLDGAPGPLHLITSEDRVEIDRDGARVALAVREGRTWIVGASPTPAESSALALVVAVDVDLAVQGTSIVFGGRRYAQCTLDCLFASSCAPRLDPQAGACAKAISTCGACLDAEP